MNDSMIFCTMTNKQIKVMTEYNLDELKVVKVTIRKHLNLEIARDITEPRDVSVIAATQGGSLTGVLLDNEGVVANAKLGQIEELSLVTATCVKRNNESCLFEKEVYCSSTSQNTHAVGASESKEISLDTGPTQPVMDGARSVERYPTRKPGNEVSEDNQPGQVQSGVNVYLT